VGGVGVGGVAPNPQSPIPNPQSPIPNPQYILQIKINLFIIFIYLKIIKEIKLLIIFKWEVYSPNYMNIYLIKN